ncbi:type II toxin-antitoxin system CcdA family antitoxin [Azospirillum rugosum]|uniref:Post-segregation antitoxin (Ccd killing protein) n=1 Tax=Azospirillum rugosum TaxID=416170 RepID=A0ABS4SJH5_9PROT|nr:type II toxin-antitoxin system CcdA family antitoxin [Azospirillum rugosum]MBP2292716.1 post-segregation antitoxin (ccd killing protein) [Azospirillum rugosum]MDQ0526260.1 post-segregation antitoxin (ccd killing protein) [Azospirillum rugosum]
MSRGAAHRKPTNVSAKPVEQSVAEAKRQGWIEENRPAFDAYDAFVERHGVFSDGKRLF